MFRVISNNRHNHNTHFFANSENDKSEIFRGLQVSYSKHNTLLLCFQSAQEHFFQKLVLLKKKKKKKTLLAFQENPF